MPSCSAAETGLSSACRGTVFIDGVHAAASASCTSPSCECIPAFEPRSSINSSNLMRAFWSHVPPRVWIISGRVVFESSGVWPKAS